MQYIGNNNYSANTLLEDSAWLNAIVNSTHFENVLNIKVPVMTSDTTPRGECISDSYSTSMGYKAYTSFDGNINNGWITGRSSFNGAWLGYKFLTETTIYMAVIQQRPQNPYGGTPERGKWQTSSDGSTWEDISDIISFRQAGNPSQTLKYVVNKSTNKYYRFFYLSGNYDANQNSASIVEMQFYGRQDV